MLNNPLILWISSFVAVTTGIVAIGMYIVDRTTTGQQRARRRLHELGHGTEPEGGHADTGRMRRAVSRIGGVVGLWSGKGATRLRSKLALAGYTQPSAEVYYRGIQLVLIVLFALTGGIAAMASGVPWSKAILWAVIGGTVGFLGPSFILSSYVSTRQRQLRNALPDALDIMVLCVEGGASLNAAITWVAEEIEQVHPLLGLEMQIVQREMQLGLPAGEAFRGFADRSGVSEVRDLAATLLQSERYGASVAKSLRAYADSARQEHQLWAEEMAHKAAVKILFPMLICIFPAMFIVLLGPAAFQMSSMFSK
jgi:tight adherence protein C